MSDDNYLVFSLKYRPQTFDDIRCQEPVKETLKKAILNNRVAHSYLFCGPRGVGKTTTARILAKALNCEKGPTITPCGVCSSCKEITASRSMDVIEIDGASNRQIDDIRDLRENIKYSPSSGRYKVYIIDEVHMLTEFAFNALLKTLEEPPRHAKFIFATTAPHKVPSTILSRCQRFDFRKATVEELVALLRDIAKREKIKADDEALFAIARRAEGSIRDAETIFDQMSSFRPEGIILKDVEGLLGMVPSEVYGEFVAALRAQDTAALITFVNEVFDRGYNVVEFFTGLALHVRSLLALKLGISRETLGLSPADLKRAEDQAAHFTAAELSTMLETIVGYEESIKFSLVPRVLLEVMALKLAANEAGIGDRGPNPESRIPTSRPPTASRKEPPTNADERRTQNPEPRTQNTGHGAQRGAATTQNTEGRTQHPPSDTQQESQKSELGIKNPASSFIIHPSSFSSLWDQFLTELHTSKPLLASIMESAQVLGGTQSEIRITAPAAPMWDEADLKRELAGVAELLTRIAGHTVNLVVGTTADTEAASSSQPNAGGKQQPAGKKKGSAAEKFKAVYDCDEVK